MILCSVPVAMNDAISMTLSASAIDDDPLQGIMPEKLAAFSNCMLASLESDLPGSGTPGTQG